MSTILVTGASGFVGSHLVPRCSTPATESSRSSATRTAAATGRGAGSPPAQRDAVETRIGDVTRPATLAGGPRRRRRGPPPRRHPARLRRRRDPPAGQHRGDAERAPGRARGRASAGSSTSGAMGVVDDPDLHYASSKAKAIALVRDERARLDGPRRRRSCSGRATGSSTSSRAWSGCRRASSRSPAPARRGSSRWRSTTSRGRRSTSRRRRRRSGASTCSAGRATGRTARSSRRSCAGWGSGGLLVPMPVPLIRLVAGSAELVRLPFPVATDQLRQLKLDNVGPLGRVRVGVRVRARGRWRAA